MNRIQFIGNTLFVPFFLISVGMLIDPLILIREPKSLVVAAVMIVAELVSKYLAAWISGKWFGYKFPSTMVMFGLSIAQAASTLAAITVAYEIKLVDRTTVNGIVAMILFTCIASPLVTERWGRQVTTTEKSLESSDRNKILTHRVLVPVANPNNEDNLLNLALILAKTTNGTLLPLNVLSDRDRTIAPEARIQQRQLLDKAEAIAHASNARVETIGRVDDEIDRGIVRTAIERDASLVICGWRGYSTYQDSFFGSTIDNVARQLPIPVLIARFVGPVANTDRVFLAVTNKQALSPEFKQTLNIAKMLSKELKTSLEVLSIATNKQSQLSPQELSNLSADTKIGQAQGNFIKEVSQKLYKNDLLLLPVKTSETMIRSRSAVGTIPEAIARSHENISVVVIHFP